MTCILIKRGKLDTVMHREERLCAEGRRWPSTSKGERPQSETNPADTLILNFPASRNEKINFFCLIHLLFNQPVVLVMVALDN